MMKINALKVAIGFFAFFPLSEETCKDQIEKVDCTQRDTTNLFYTCQSDLKSECLCIIENPLLSDLGWHRLCNSKSDLKSKKKKLRKRQLRAVDRCGAIQPPRPGKVSCSMSPNEITCKGKCNYGYKFSDMSQEHSYLCYYREGIWMPKSTFPNCEPDCVPPCRNGGVCIAPSVCSCPNNYRGDRCQYPLALCSILKKSMRASSWTCNYTRAETICDISCYAPRTYEAITYAQRYLCTVNGMWSPPLPECVEGSNLCSDPGGIEFGRSISTGIDFKVGSSVEYKCDAGYVISGSAKIMCYKDGKWLPEKPKCTRLSVKSTTTTPAPVPEQCPKPHAPKNSIVQVSLPNQGALRTFFSSNFHVRIWNESSPEHDYSMSSILHRRKLYFTLTTNSTEDQDLSDTEGMFMVGTRVQYKCKSRFYKLYGSEYQTCQPSHTWSGYQPACVPDCGKSDAPKTPFIVNGDSSRVGHWPWMVGIVFKSPKGLQLICGGVLISESWVLTAAHCVTKPYTNVPMDPKTLLAFCGKHYRKFTVDDEYVQVKQIKQVIIHDEYDFIHFDVDIALLKLEEPVELTTRVQPICLPTEVTTRENIRDGKKGIVIGWGLTENGTYSDILRETILPVVSHDKCEEAYREGLRTVTVTKSMFCAGHEEGIFDTCNGDSGGPYMFSIGPSNDIRWYLEGLVSWGSESGCAKAQRYSGFTKVGAFVSWINMFI